MDDGDRAAAYQQHLNDQATAAHLSRRTAQAESADECMICGRLIPSARQIAVPGCQLCIDCAEDMERQQ